MILIKPLLSHISFVDDMWLYLSNITVGLLEC